MATTAQIDAALGELRAARAKLFDLAQKRLAAIQRRDKAVAEVAALNTAITAQQAVVAQEKTDLTALLGQTETP
jgi:hypothetical protein